MNDQRDHLMMKQKSYSSIPISFAPAIAALVALGFEVEVLDPTDARIKISIVTELSEDDFHAWVDALPPLIEHDGEVLSWGRANRMN